MDIPKGSFLVCDGCGEATPIAGSREEIRLLAATKGWSVDVGELSEDYCARCAKARS